MYYLCEKYYTPIPAQYYIADCVSWVPMLIWLDFQTNWTYEPPLLEGNLFTCRGLTVCLPALFFLALEIWKALRWGFQCAISFGNLALLLWLQAVKEFSFIPSWKQYPCCCHGCLRSGKNVPWQIWDASQSFPGPWTLPIIHVRRQGLDSGSWAMSRELFDKSFLSVWTESVLKTNKQKNDQVLQTKDLQDFLLMEKKKN